MDRRLETRDGRASVEFTWEGSDEGDQAASCGWAVLTDDRTLNGHTFFHLGDDSGFQAVRAAPGPTAPRRTA